MAAIWKREFDMSTPEPIKRRAIVHITSSRLEINAWPFLVVDFDLGLWRQPRISELLAMPTSAVRPEIQSAVERFAADAGKWWRGDADQTESPDR